jgi:hypothetical protein
MNEITPSKTANELTAPEIVLEYSETLQKIKDVSYMVLNTSNYLANALKNFLLPENKILINRVFSSLEKYTQVYTGLIDHVKFCKAAYFIQTGKELN